MRKSNKVKLEGKTQNKGGLFSNPYKLHKLFTDYTISIAVGFGIYYWYSLFDWDMRFALFFSFWAVGLAQMQLKGE